MYRSLLIATVVCGVGVFTSLSRAAADHKYPDISIKDLKKAIDKHEVTLIDANGSESYAEGHIPGAIDFAAVGDKLAAKLPKEKDALVVAYCGGPQCMAYKAAAEK